MDLLRIEGAIEHRRDLSFLDLAALPGQIPDVVQLVCGREGGGVHPGRSRARGSTPGGGAPRRDRRARQLEWPRGASGSR